MNKRKLGGSYEQIAAEYLEGLGYCILARNYRCKSGEIDIIAKDGEAVCFIEVKYRKTVNYGYPGEAISDYKKFTIWKTAKYYLHTNGYGEETTARFDAVLILNSEIIHLKNAFGGI